MFFDRLLKPAISVMNRLPFKLKIIASISILFTLLILPSRSIFTSYISKNAAYDKQLIGLSYNVLIHDLIISIQTHRGRVNGYLNGEKTFKKSVLVEENKIEEKLKNLIAYDKKHLLLLKNNREFANALSHIELIYLKNITKRATTDSIFKIHTNVISLLIQSFAHISVKTSFVNSEDAKVNFIAQMLQEKMLLLEENIGQLRGLATGVFADHHISQTQKQELLSIYTLVKSLENNILDNKVLTPMDNYLDIQKETTLATYKLDEILEIVNQNIFMVKEPVYDGKEFFEKATLAINKYTALYKKLVVSYEALVQTLHDEAMKNLTMLLIGFFAILFSSIYIFSAFYKSIAHSLKKLEIASTAIARGDTSIQLEADTKDELGTALLAFNDMSKKLDKNISFLDGYKMAIDETSIVSKTDAKGIITYVNQLFCDISGYDEKELLGRSHNIVRHEENSKEFFKQMWATIKAKKVWKGIVKNRTKDGGYYIVDATVIPILDGQGEIVEFIGVRHDVTELERSKEEIKKQKVDILTSLPNRNQLLEDIKFAKKPILFYLNIDEFASLNDFYGSKMGDNVLVYIANSLKKVKASQAKLYKLYADEFLILFEEGTLHEKNCFNMMSEIINSIERDTVKCDSKSCVSVTLSGGIAYYSDGEEFEKLISYANMARRVAKNENKKFLKYIPAMNHDKDYKSNIEWINKIKEAIKEDRIVTYYQPIIDNKSGAITKYEALVRMIDTDGEVISPFFFLDIAKKAKLYTKITKIVLDKTFANFEKLPQYEFSVNISVEDIYDEETASYIFKKLKNYPKSERVILEITESEEIKDYKAINEFIQVAKHYGAKIAIDDFGSGYANFEHIISLKADFIKIDGTLIKNIDTDEDSRIITEAIIAFSKKLGSKTVVEYVHNKAVYETVQEMGADFSQGFHLGKPNAEIVTVKEILKERETA